MQIIRTPLFATLRRLAVLPLAVAAFTLPAVAQTYAPSETVVAFTGANGHSPAGISRASDGNFYGTAYSSVFKITSAGVFTSVAALNDDGSQGAQIEAGVVLAGDGNLYGTALGGGASGYGTVFRVTPAGTVTKLVDFNGTNGSYPGCQLVLASDGAMYGVTQQGGANNRGAIFKVTTAGVVSVVASLSDSLGSGGYRVGLAEGPDGALYGMGEGGGATGGGTVYKVDTATGTVTKLADLNYSTIGSNPQGGLTVGPDGALYGVVQYGGANGEGTAIRVTTTGTVTKIADFSNSVTGSFPRGQMVLAGDGNFYGVTEYGIGNDGAGAVFRLTPAGVLTGVAYAPEYGPGYAGAISGTELRALALTDDGSLLGAAARDGSNGSGAIFRLNTFIAPSTGFFVTGEGAYIPAGFTGAFPANATLIRTDASVGATRTYTITNRTASSVTVNSVTKTGSSNISLSVAGLPATLAPNDTHTFTLTYLSALPDGDVAVTVASTDATNPSYQFQVDGRINRIVKIADMDSATTGSFPRSDLLPDGAGNFYFSTTYGNWGTPTEKGVALKITPSGTVTPLAGFQPVGGGDPYGQFVAGPGGLLYCFTASGGASNQGAFFSMTTAGVLTQLATIGTGVNPGSSPYGSPVLANDGNFYGLTRFGGSGQSNGTIFRVTPSGVVTGLFFFDDTTGKRPTGSLTLGSDGALYGMTAEGGANYSGTVFKFTTAGVFTKLADFDFATTGGYPHEDLIEGSDGNFYGTTGYGGAGNSGTIFKMTPAGVLTKLADFDGNSMGKYPEGSLVEASDGNFYGLAKEGGAGGVGTVFRITPAGVFTKVGDFDRTATGSEPLGSLVEGDPGVLYATASRGGPNDNGTVVKVLIGGATPPPSNAAPTDIALSNATIAENNALGATIGTLSATDPDAGQTHTFTFASGAGDADNAAFTITGAALTINGSADFETKPTYSVRIRATDNGSPTAGYDEVFTITITDVSLPQSIAFEPPATALSTDTVTLSATGGASGNAVTFSIISGPGSLAGDSLTFTGTGSVTVRASQAGSGDYLPAADVDGTITVVTPPLNSNRWQGLLSNTGGTTGWMQISKNNLGVYTASFKVGTSSGKATFSIPEGETSVTVTTTLGALVVTPDEVSGHLHVSLPGGEGTLQFGHTSATPRQYNIALSSAAPAVTGGGYARVNVESTGDVSFTGKTPDGRGFSGSTRLDDSDGFALYVTTTTANPAARISGVFATADLATTDVTGTVNWTLPAQGSGLHAAGITAELDAAGSLYTTGDATLINGPGTLTITGGNLAADVIGRAVTVTAGKPTLAQPLPGWTVTASNGTFTPKVKIPAYSTARTGSGVYLPKSRTAWGFFPGSTIAGKVQLTLP